METHITCMLWPNVFLFVSILLRSFCFYAYEGYWPLIFFSYGVLIWLWYAGNDRLYEICVLERIATFNFKRHNFFLYEMYSPVEITKLIIYKMHL